jgi:pimeloyl-ACP methyl ester carboxylesterase
MLEPETIDVATPAVQLRVQSWGPEGAPIALCLHGFPDTAHGWRTVAPLLVDAGWRVITPFNRGYAPSSLPSDGSFHIGALMDDALRVLDAVGPTGRDVMIGHDWGAMAGAGLAAMPDSPFQKAVIMSVPPPASFTPLIGRLVATLPAQLLKSWYILFFQLPWLPERSTEWIVPRLWRKWSPDYQADEDVRHVQAAIGAPDRWRAALGYYRAVVRNTKVPPQYAELHEHWLEAPRIPTLYLHGRDDGCATADYAQWVEKILPGGSEVAIVENAGHFLQLDQPEVVARRILDFIE